MNPLDWYGGAFLALYAFLFAGALVGSMAIAAWLRPAGRLASVTDEDELAVLAGGEARLAETAVARLVARGEAWVDDGLLVLDDTALGRTRAEREVVKLSSPVRWRTVRHRMGAIARPIEKGLVDRGLLLEARVARVLGFHAANPFVPLIVFGLIKLEVGLGRGRPVGFLVVFLIVTLVVAVFRVFATDRRTKAGIAAVRDARDRSQRMRRAPTREDTGTAVALWGTAVLVGSPLADLHKLRRNNSDGGGGGGDGDGDGGCGGGCGGCGS